MFLIKKENLLIKIFILSFLFTTLEFVTCVVKEQLSKPSKSSPRTDGIELMTLCTEVQDGLLDHPWTSFNIPVALEETPYYYLKTVAPAHLYSTRYSLIGFIEFSVCEN